MSSTCKPSSTWLKENPFHWTFGCLQPASRSRPVAGAEDVAAAAATATAAEDEAGKLKEKNVT